MRSETRLLSHPMSKRNVQSMKAPLFPKIVDWSKGIALFSVISAVEKIFLRKLLHIIMAITHNECEH